MFKTVKCLLGFVVLLNLASCSNKNNVPVIKFSADSSSIILKNIDEASLFQIRHAYRSNPGSVKFISVLLTPGESDSLQAEENIFGQTSLVGDSIIFLPDKPFVKGKVYLVESYVSVKFGDERKLFKNTIKHNLAPHQQILKR